MIFFFLPWKFLDFRPWKSEPSRENVLKTARENLKVHVKFSPKSLPWKKMVGVKKMEISTREKHKSAREKKKS